MLAESNYPSAVPSRFGMSRGVGSYDLTQFTGIRLGKHSQWSESTHRSIFCSWGGKYLNTDQGSSQITGIRGGNKAAIAG